MGHLRRPHPRSVVRRLGGLAVLPALAAALLIPGAAHAANEPNGTFSYLADGFTQELWAVGNTYPIGVAFDKDANVLTCYGGGHRFSAADSSLAHGSTIHAQSLFDSGCNGLGMANDVDGYVYNNAYDGVRRLDPNNNLALVGKPFGAPGEYTGITSDPQTGNLVYVASDMSIHWVNNALTQEGVFTAKSQGFGLIDQIAFDPTGKYLFLAALSSRALLVIDRSGGLVQTISMEHQPDGIAFHADQPHFVATNNTDGTLSRFDFAGDDYTKAPTQSLFGSGAGYGDHTGVGPDGCWYVSNSDTKYADGSSAGTGLVRICPGFAPQPGLAKRAGNFTCRASALRTGGVLPVLEPQVADGGNDPCVADAASNLGLGSLLGLLSAQTTSKVPGKLPADGDEVDSDSTVATVLPTVIGGHTISAKGLSSHAQVSCNKGAKGLTPAFAGTSNIVSVTIDGKTASTTGSISLNGGLLAVKIGVTSTSATEVVQRALEVDLNGVPVLVAAEARAGVKDAPCATA